MGQKMHLLSRQKVAFLGYTFYFLLRLGEKDATRQNAPNTSEQIFSFVIKMLRILDFC